MKKLIIVATYNEKDNIEPLVHQIFSTVSDADVLVIDDNSPDQTYKLVEDMIANKYPDKLSIMKRAGKLGLGTAYIAGFNYALERGYEIILHMDADFSHNPKYLPTMFELVKTNDLVLGSRYVRGGSVVNWGVMRKIISVGGSLYSRAILGISTRDLTGGFKCFRANVLQTIGINELESTGYSFQVETTYKTILNGFRVIETPIVFEDRRVGQSKMSGNIFAEALIMVLKLRLNSKKFIRV